MLKTPPGVEFPFVPVLTVERPMRMPLRYTCIVCSGTLTSTMSGPFGESCGVPPILARLEHAGGFAGGRAFCVGRRLLHCLRGEAEGDDGDEGREEFHELDGLVEVEVDYAAGAAALTSALAPAA